MDLFFGALIALLAAGTTQLGSWAIGRAKPYLLTETGGIIRPERWVSFGTILFFSGLTAFSIYWFVFDGGSWVSVTAGVFAAFGAISMAPAMTSIHEIKWDERGINGPSRILGLTLGRERIQLSWGKIEKFGNTPTGYWYVESTSGDRIYYSHLYRGNRYLTADISRYCPFIKVEISED